MTQTRATAPNPRPPGPPPPPGPTVVRATGEFGELARIAGEILRGDGVVVIEPFGWRAEPGAALALAGGLHRAPGAAFAFGEAGGDGIRRPGAPGTAVDAEMLVARPRPLGLLAVRAREAARIGWPDFGPPDHVLDSALTWAVAAALAMRGGNGICIPGAGSEPSNDRGLEMGCLRPDGIAWLVSMALSWGPRGRPGEDLAGRLWRRWTGAMGAAGFDGLTPGARR